MTPPGLRLQQPIARREDGRLTISCDLDGAPALWVVHEGPARVLDRIEPRIEPFIPMALLMAGVAERPLEVEPPVDPAYLDTLRFSCIPLQSLLFGFPMTELRVDDPVDGSVTPAERRPPAPVDGQQPGSAALLFSAGVDSFYTLIRLRRAGRSPDLLANINAGAHGQDRVLMQRRLARVRDVAQAIGADLHVIDTNFHEVLVAPHVSIFPFRQLPAALTLYGAVERLIASTAYAFQNLKFDGAIDGLEILGANITSAIAWQRVPITEVGYDATRYEKTRLVADDPLTYRTLDVCVDGAYQASAGPDDPANCTRCFKCRRVALTLDHLGRLDRYPAQFDVDYVSTHRDELLAALAKRGRELDQDLLANMRGDVKRPPTLELEVPAWALAVDR